MLRLCFTSTSTSVFNAMRYIIYTNLRTINIRLDIKLHTMRILYAFCGLRMCPVPGSESREVHGARSLASKQNNSCKKTIGRFVVLTLLVVSFLGYTINTVIRYDIRYTIYDVRYTIYDIRIYDIRYTMYDTRYTVYDIRYTICELWYMIYGTRYTIYDIRYTIHDTRYTIYSIRCTMYDIRYTIYDNQFTLSLSNLEI